jgi:hypothetical protein
MEIKVLKADKALLVIMVLKVIKVIKELKEFRAFKAHQMETKVLKVDKALLVIMVLKVIKAIKELKEFRVFKVHQMETKVLKADKVSLVIMVLKVPLGITALKVLKADKVPLVIMALKAIKVTLELKVIKVIKVIKEFRAFKVHQMAIKVPKVDKGVAGNNGAQGNQGAAGNNGAQGNQGDAGAQGNQGNQGNNGAQGVQGVQGKAFGEGPCSNIHYVSGDINQDCGDIYTAGSLLVTGNITGLGHTQFGDSNIDQHVFSGAVLGLRNTSAFDITSTSPIVNILDQAGANTPGTINFGGDVGTLNIGQAGTTLFSSGDSFFGAECSNNHHFSGDVYLDCISTDSNATDVLVVDSNKVIKRNSLAGGQFAQGLAADRYPTVSVGSNSDRAVDLYNVTGNGINIFACKNESGNTSYDSDFRPHIYLHRDAYPSGNGDLPQPQAVIFYDDRWTLDGVHGLYLGVTGDAQGSTDLPYVVNVGVTITDTELNVGANMHINAGSGIHLAGQVIDPAAGCRIVASDGSGGETEGENGQVLTSYGATPVWAYVSSSSWDSSGFTFEDEVRNVSSQAGDPIKTAIVESVSGQYVDLYCVESPDVRFEDVVSIKANGRLKIEQEIDPEFVFVCEQNSIKAVSYTTTEPALCGVKVKENKLIITFSGNIPEEVTVKLSGIRKGLKGVRFTPKTKEQADHNNDFWNQSKL